MTIEINLTAEVNRIYSRMQVETPGSDVYHRLVQDLQTTVALLRAEEVHARFAKSAGLLDEPCDRPCPEGEPGEPGIPEEPVTAAEENVSMPEQEAPSQDPPKPEEPKPDPGDLPKKADVRLALGKARTERGINVTAILQELGVDNFNDLPAARYPELLEKLG